MCLTEHLLVHCFLNRLIGTERVESLKLQMRMTTFETTENLSKEFTSYLVFFPIYSLDSFAGQPAHRPCLCCRHTGIEHIGPGGCFWAISAICNMGSLPSCLPLLIRLKFYSKPIQHYQLENFAS